MVSLTEDMQLVGVSQVSVENKRCDTSNTSSCTCQLTRVGGARYKQVANSFGMSLQL